MNEQDLAGATYAVIDIETTGFDPSEHRIVEIACVVLREGGVVDSLSTLVNPERAIPADTSAIHGIYDRHVAYAPTLCEIEQRLRTMTSGAVIVAHNARFDLAFLPFLGDRPVICTMRLAMHLVDTTSYKNRALCEILGVEGGLAREPAHHAAADARVTADVLSGLLRLYAKSNREQTVSGLINAIAEPALLGRFAFGDYRGEPIESVPTEYLRLIVERNSQEWPDVRYTAERELESRALAAAS